MVVGGAILLARGGLTRVVVDVSRRAASDPPVHSTAAAERASHLAEAGDYRMALRFLVLQTLLGLQEAGVMELRPGLTNREYLEALRRTADWCAPGREPLETLVDEFDRVWYGHFPIDAERYRGCEQLAGEALLRASGRQAA
jgi:hypothetical protein